jgi:hypothetical protein
MQRFVARQNIEHFKDLLSRETDKDRRTLLERMIAEEEAKLGGKPDTQGRDPAE